MNVLIFIAGIVFILTSLAHMLVQILALFDRYRTRHIVNGQIELAEKGLMFTWMEDGDENEDDFIDMKEHLNI